MSAQSAREGAWLQLCADAKKVLDLKSDDKRARAIRELLDRAGVEMPDSLLVRLQAVKTARDLHDWFGEFVSPLPPANKWSQMLIDTSSLDEYSPE